MRRHLIRHGEAVDESIDARRPLSNRGRREAASLAERMCAEGEAAQRIFHSGKTRAEETASILAAALQPPNGIAALTQNGNATSLPAGCGEAGFSIFGGRAMRCSGLPST